MPDLSIEVDERDTVFARVRPVLKVQRVTGLGCQGAGPARLAGSGFQEANLSGRKVASMGCSPPVAISHESNSPTMSPSVAPLWLKAT